MAKNWLMGVLLGMLLVYQGEAVKNILGEGISVPLIKWDPKSIQAIIAKDSEIRKVCEDNNISEAEIRAKRGSLVNCNSKLQPGGNIDYDTFDMDYACKNIDEYTKCVHDELKKIKNTCKLIGEDKEYVENADKMHEKIAKLMCKNDEKKYKAFEKNGMQCAKDTKAELMKCSKDNTEDDMDYDKDDCMKAWDFVECVEDTLEDCKEHASDVPVDIMSEALMVTKCKGEKPNGSWSAAPVAFFTMMSSFVLLVFVY